MNKSKLGTIVLHLVFSLVFIGHSSCQNNSKKVQTIGVNEYQKKMDATSGIQLIDVRTPEEYKEGHLKGSVNYNWDGNTFEEDVKKLDKNKAVFVYCLAGGRSAAAASKLEKMGFTEIYNMEGGMMAWNKLNKPVETLSITAATSGGMSVKDYEHLVKKNKLTLVDFNAPWCGPCKKMKPILAEISKEQESKLKIIEINADDNEILAANMKIEALPTFVLYKDGKPVERFLGFRNKEAMLSILSKYF